MFRFQFAGAWGRHHVALRSVAAVLSAMQELQPLGVMFLSAFPLSQSVISHVKLFLGLALSYLSTAWASVCTFCRVRGGLGGVRTSTVRDWIGDSICEPRRGNSCLRSVGVGALRLLSCPPRGHWVRELRLWVPNRPAIMFFPCLFFSDVAACFFCYSYECRASTPRQVWELDTDPDTGFCMICPTAQPDAECRSLVLL